MCKECRPSAFVSYVHFNSVKKVDVDQGEGGGGEGESHRKWLGMLAVSLSAINQRSNHRDQIKLGPRPD